MFNQKLISWACLLAKVRAVNRIWSLIVWSVFEGFFRLDDLQTDEIEETLISIWKHCQCVESKRTEGAGVGIGYNLSVSFKYNVYLI